MAKKKNSGLRKFIIASCIVIAIALAGIIYAFYQKIYSPNISLAQLKEQYVYIPTGSTFNDVMRILGDQHLLDNQASFEWVAERMKYKNRVLPGRYLIKKKMSNHQLISLLRSGVQEPVDVIFNAVRTKEQLAGVVSQQIEADSSDIMDLLKDEDQLQSIGFNTTNCMALFIPNTYEFYWNTSADEFLERMASEYKKFWNTKRKNLAKKINLSQTQVSVLASIVEQETYRNAEKPTIAGVYMNRYLKGWRLEADPTLIFAAGDFSIQRVLNVHKEIDSPYNTYMYTGLPPGPICIPSIASLDAVLNYTNHEYMFFCAREDFSGYHSFARTYSEHLVNARRFQNELNRRKIRS